MAPFILWQLEQAGIDHALAKGLLGPLGDIATGWAVRRQLALRDLASLAQEKGIRLIVIKGTAIALKFYPKSRLRVSRDIDVLCDPEEVSKAGIFLPDWDEPGALRPHHAKPFDIQGTPIEFHCRQTYYPDWGFIDQLTLRSAPLPGFENLLSPSVELAFTGSALHIVSHALETPWDLIDLGMMTREHDPDYAFMQGLWSDAGVGRFVWPVLMICQWIGLPVSGDVSAELWSVLSRSEKRIARKLLTILCAAHYQRIRRDQCRCLLRGVSFARHLCSFLWGDLRTTRKETGLSVVHPRFWWQHFVSLPRERLGRYFWE